MTKRYSDTLRERAELAHNEWTTFSDGYSAALVHVADELDSPEFSGRIVYEQRNAALEEVKRLKRRVADLEDAIAMACEEPLSGCECAGCENARQYGVGDETNLEDG